MGCLSVFKSTCSVTTDRTLALISIKLEMRSRWAGEQAHHASTRERIDREHVRGALGAGLRHLYRDLMHGGFNA